MPRISEFKKNATKPNLTNGKTQKSNTKKLNNKVTALKPVKKIKSQLKTEETSQTDSRPWTSNKIQSSLHEESVNLNSEVQFEKFKEIEFIREKAPRVFSLMQNFVRKLDSDADEEVLYTVNNKYVDQIINKNFLILKKQYKNQPENTFIRKIVTSIKR